MAKSITATAHFTRPASGLVRPGTSERAQIAETATRKLAPIDDFAPPAPSFWMMALKLGYKPRRPRPFHLFWRRPPLG